jgi:hypothetical protein
MMKDKKGGLGGFVALFMATTFIVLAIFLMIFFSSTVKVFAEQKTGIDIQRESDLGIENIYTYARQYPSVFEEYQDITGDSYGIEEVTDEE